MEAIFGVNHDAMFYIARRYPSGRMPAAIKSIMASIFIIFCSSVGYSQRTPEHFNKDVRAYFLARLHQTETDSILMPFEGRHTIRIKDIPKIRAEIWQLYRGVVSSETPLAVPVNASAQVFPVNHWNLIKEDPMPFYYFLKDSGQTLNQPLPLYLALHGSGPRDHEFAATLKWCLRYNDGPSYYFIPQIPTEKRYRWWYKAEQYAWERLFRSSVASGKVDPNRIYVLGISEGGYGSQRLGAFYADYLAGAGPMAGGEPLQNAPVENFRNIAFSLQTGSLDSGFGRNSLTLRAKTAFDSLAHLNPGFFIHKIELQPGRGHHIDYTVTTPWLKQFIRNPYPLQVSWIRYPMDGRYRSGFYNIAIESDLGTKEWDRFDRSGFTIVFDRKHNKIFISAYLTTPELDQRESIRRGKIGIFLDQHYINLKKKVTVYLNKKEVFNAKVPIDKKYMAESCGLFGDSARVFPAKISIQLQ